MATFDLKKALSNLNEFYDKSALPSIANYIEIPNQSPAFDPEWATNGLMEQAITLLSEWVKSENVPGLTLEIIRLEGRTPIIFMTKDAHNSDQTVLMYGHLDKQPPLTEAWDEGLHPYKPVMKDGKLYGRGGADDGYSTYACIGAIKAILAQGAPHAAIRVIIEAREESGSQDLESYVKHLKDRIGIPSLIVCLDSGCGNYEQFWLTTSLRGCVMGALNVKVLKEAVHSGHASGIVPSSFRIIRKLLNRIEDVETGQVTVPAVMKPIPEFRVQEQRETASILGEEFLAEYPFYGKTKPMNTDPVELMLNRNWRATVSYTGIDGVPSVSAGGNVLRTDTTLKISMRVPPHVPANEAAASLKEVLEKEPPFDAHVEFQVGAAMSGWASPQLASWLEDEISAGSTAVFGKKHACLGEGGSIPFMGMLGDLFPKAQFVITGILGPASNAHGPNEFLHVDMVKKVTTVVSGILVKHAQLKG